MDIFQVDLVRFRARRVILLTKFIYYTFYCCGLLYTASIICLNLHNYFHYTSTLSQRELVNRKVSFDF